MLLPDLTPSKATTIASDRITFKDGEVVKEAFIEAVGVLFGHFKNKMEIVSTIKDMQLSRNTVTRRCEGMAEDVETQLKMHVSVSPSSLTCQLTWWMWHNYVFLSGWFMETCW